MNKNITVIGGKMDFEQIYRYLCLLYSEKITYKSALNFILNDSSLIKNINCKDIKTKIKSVEQDYEWGRKSGNHIITYGDKNYPNLLKEITSPPLLLYVQGDVSLLNAMQIAIVGSRKAGIESKNIAGYFAQELANIGFVITSGLALGIDSASHLGALKTGKTIAVLGSGNECIYPYENRRLAKKIITQGALISEYSPFAKPTKFSFPQRNRIISGMTKGVIVVEAGLKSGSIITAKLALEQNREVFVVPNSMNNPNFVGSHNLIREGAKLVDKVEHVLEEFINLLNFGDRVKKPLAKDVGFQQTIAKLLNTKSIKLLEHLSYKSLTMDELKLATKMDSSELNMELIKLELGSYITKENGSYHLNITTKQNLN